MESLYTYAIFIALVMAIAVPYWLRTSRQKRKAAETYAKNLRADTLYPATLHPRVDLLACIGCAACVQACPEGVMGIIDGRAAIVSGMRCIGHGICADVCPVGGITLAFGKPRAGQEIPYYDEYYQTNVGGMYIVGELGGVGLIRNAVAQALTAVEHLSASRPSAPADGYDVVIIGAGPAGLTAALACQEKGLRYVVLEQDEIGGTILHYPKQKLVLTRPVELPLYGKLNFTEISKEQLLGIWQEIVAKFKLTIVTHSKVDAIDSVGDHFSVNAAGKTYRAARVCLAIGRRGSPRKLGVPGENLSKVMYKLLDAESYNGKDILIVGGGDSAVEAAIGLASQKRNTITISYRRDDFVRLKEKNEQRIRDLIASQKVNAIFNSNVKQITSSTAVVVEGEKVYHNLKNDYLFVFAGGELPSALLTRIGIQLRTEEEGTKAA